MLAVLAAALTLPFGAAAQVSGAIGFVVRPDMAGWQGAVCWAEKGKPIRVTADGAWTMADGELPYVGPQGYGREQGRFRHGALILQIGCHTDDLSRKQSPKRPPIVYERHAVAGELTVTPKYGGLVYFLVNDKDHSDNAGEMAVLVEGAYPAAVVHKSSPVLDDWPRAAEHVRGPWGEFHGDYVVLTLPLDRMRTVKDPAKLMHWWDTLYLHYCDLDGRGPGRAKTRYVPDVDISRGFMHAGNPIVYKMSTIPRLINMERADFPSWGFLHELGHNFQRHDYNFEGTSEVTCNIFTLYGFQKMGLEQVVEGKRRQAYFKTLLYMARGARFEDWRRDPFTGLAMYVELLDAFGWEPFRRMFRTYWQLSPEERPRNNDQKRDLFVTVMSRCTGRNLSPFFHRWGIPTSPAAGRTIWGLRPWVGADWFCTRGKMFVGLDCYHGEILCREAVWQAKERGVRFRALVTPLSYASLSGLDALLLTDTQAKVDATPQEAAVLEEWIARGGVFVAAPLTWVAQRKGRKPPRETNANVLVSSLDVYFSPRQLRNENVPVDAAVPKGYTVFGSDTMAAHRLLEGVDLVGFKGVPGVTETQSGQVLVWAEGGQPEKERRPFLVLVPHGKGYVVAFQHAGLFADEHFKEGHCYGNARLWENLMQFVVDHRRALAAGRGRRGALRTAAALQSVRDRAILSVEVTSQ